MYSYKLLSGTKHGVWNYGKRNLDLFQIVDIKYSNCWYQQLSLLY